MNAAEKLKAWLASNSLPHKKWVDALNKTTTFATFAEPGSLVLLIGPTGAGKSRLLDDLIGRLAGSPLQWPTGKIPVARVSLVNDVQGFFHSKDFYLRCLSAVQHPYYSLPREDIPVECRETLWLEKLRLKYSESHLRLALEHAMQHRGTRYFFIDEIDALLRVPSRQRSIDHLDSLRGLAKLTGAIFVLAGTYLALEIWNRSAQLNRLTFDVHLGRYIVSSDDDLIEFERVLDALSQVVPLRPGASLRDWNDVIYEGTLGVMGEIVRLLLASLALMEHEGASVLSREIIEKAIMQRQKLDTLIREIRSGELTLLGNTDLPDLGPERPDEDTGNSGVRQHRNAASKKGRRRPGRRNPTRDPVGSKAI